MCVCVCVCVCVCPYVGWESLSDDLILANYYTSIIMLEVARQQACISEPIKYGDLCIYI